MNRNAKAPVGHGKGKAMSRLYAGSFRESLGLDIAGPARAVTDRVVQ
jgi:hypothetical protein